MKNIVKVIEQDEVMEYTHEEWYGEEIKEEETMSNYTVESIVKILSDNGWKETEITCPDGAEIVINPCGYGDVKSLDDVDCFLVYADIPWMGGMNGKRIGELVEQINGHAQAVADLESEREELRKYFEGGEADGWTQHDWSWYSDWHKDLYGYRPHGHVCGEYVRPW